MCMKSHELHSYSVFVGMAHDLFEDVYYSAKKNAAVSGLIEGAVKSGHVA